MNDEEFFLKEKLIPSLKKIDPDTKGKWGVMSPQQMVEHLGDSLANAYGRLILPYVTPPEKKEAFHQFLMSDIPFRENTKNPIMPVTPMAPKFSNLSEAIEKLEKRIRLFFETFEKDPSLVTINPVFGPLNFEQNIHLLYKHTKHHLKQFGIEN
ncbi:MAG: hypothetical protein JSS67_12265 [Bacteroidetes bacterium]|nr:hypothetical protein [Bacteroidota bacterium]